MQLSRNRENQISTLIKVLVYRGLGGNWYMIIRIIRTKRQLVDEGFAVAY